MFAEYYLYVKVHIMYPVFIRIFDRRSRSVFKYHVLVHIRESVNQHKHSLFIIIYDYVIFLLTLIRGEFRNDKLKVIREGEKKPGRFEMDESLVAVSTLIVPVQRWQASKRVTHIPWPVVGETYACTHEAEARDALIQMRLACVSPPEDRKLARRACSVTRIRCPGVRLSWPDTSTKGHAPILFPSLTLRPRTSYTFAPFQRCDLRHFVYVATEHDLFDLKLCRHSMSLESRIFQTFFHFSSQRYRYC